MSDFSRGPGWWIASDGKWYPPELHPSKRPPAPPVAHGPRRRRRRRRRTLAGDVRRGWRWYRSGPVIRQVLIGGGLVLLMAAVAGAIVSEGQRPSPSRTTALLVAAPVVETVTDGDTLQLADGTRIRLIGIDAPEQGTCLADEATARLREMTPPGTRLRLEYDVERTDAFGRTLAYVYREADNLFVNMAMIDAGLARPLTVSPNTARAHAFSGAASAATAANRGLWGACTTTSASTTTSQPTSTVAPATVPTTAAPPPTTARPVTTEPSSCSPAYPTVCIPPPPPDLDCPDIPYRRFHVVAPDPHRFDGSDNDGIGCESGGG